jgi:5-amino-6-(5-phosphoribosylamino)uracil reductase
MSADGKIADEQRSPARFGSANDKAHLEHQIALADAVLFGAGTLRAYGSTLRVSHPNLLHQRSQQGKPLQPVQIVCSKSANLDPNYPFFSQPIPRWLLTTPPGAQQWEGTSNFDRILNISNEDGEIDWIVAFQTLLAANINHLVVCGGGELVSALLALDAIDEIWLTICPLLLGGKQAPSPVDGTGFFAESAPRLALIETRVLEQEVFLHYRLHR